MNGVGRKNILEQFDNSALWEKFMTNTVETKIDSLWEKYVFSPIEKRIDARFELVQEYLKVNGLDVIGLIAITIIIFIGLRMFLYKKEKDGTVIYITVVCYTVIRLFWRVILHV